MLKPSIHDRGTAQRASWQLRPMRRRIEEIWRWIPRKPTKSGVADRKIVPLSRTGERRTRTGNHGDQRSDEAMILRLRERSRAGRLPGSGMYLSDLAYRLIVNESVISDGHLTVPDGPGLGVEVDLDVERHVFVERRGRNTAMKWMGSDDGCSPSGSRCKRSSVRSRVVSGRSVRAIR